MDQSHKSMIIKDAKGNEKECEIIYKFDSDQTQKSYVIYTDGTKENGLLKVYANIYDKTGTDLNLKPIETEEEWNTIEALLAKLEDLAHEQKNENTSN